MPAIRARVVPLLQRLGAELAADAHQAAGANTLISKGEQEAMAPGLLRDGAQAVRDLQGSGARVSAQEAADQALLEVERNIAAINQATGAGKDTLSQDEIRRLQGVNPETAARAARAYELLTGKHIVLDGTVPAPAPSALPDAARVAITDVLVSQHGLARAARVDLKDVVARDGGFLLKVASNAFAGDVFVKQIDGRYVTAPKPFDDATYRAVQTAALKYFDSDFRADMRNWGASAAEIAAARAAFVPARALLTGESDPWSYTATYPMVFQIDNQSGSDHGVYAGIDAAGKVDVYAFN